jgi:hypothetical protein
MVENSNHVDCFCFYAKNPSLKIQSFAHCAINGQMENKQELGLARKT